MQQGSGKRVLHKKKKDREIIDFTVFLVEVTGLEPVTLCL